MSIVQWIGDIIMLCGVVAMSIGMYGLLRHRSLFTRLLIASKVDTMGLIFVLTGAMIRTGLNFHSMKILIIMVFAIVTNPMVSHAIARSAYTSGQRPEDKKERRRRG